MMLSRIKRAIEDPGRIKRAVKRRMPGVVNVGGRAVSRRVRYRGLTRFKKDYSMEGDSAECFQREVDARRVFADAPWILPIQEQGQDWLVFPYLPEASRLDRAAQQMGASARLKVAARALSILLDIHSRGYFHGDFHAHNLYWFQNQLILGDFEKFTAYPMGMRPPFPQAYDLTGQAPRVSLPGNQDAMAMSYRADTPAKKSLEYILDVPLQQALEALERELKDELRWVCAEFQSEGHRHGIRAQNIYNSFSLPHFTVSAAEAQRDSRKRMTRFGIGAETLHRASLLDLGCNIGGMILEAQQYRPAHSLGVEFDGEKVAVATKLAAYNGFNNVRFQQADVDKITAEALHGPYDVVFCLALITHLQDPKHLYRLLGQLTRHTLIFEGNRKTNRDEVEDELGANGFRDIKFLGLCDDDCLPDNNFRPVFSAIK